jgi:hypothetical protein
MKTVVTFTTSSRGLFPDLRRNPHEIGAENAGHRGFRVAKVEQGLGVAPQPVAHIGQGADMVADAAFAEPDIERPAAKQLWETGSCPPLVGPGEDHDAGDRGAGGHARLRVDDR